MGKEKNIRDLVNGQINHIPSLHQEVTGKARLKCKSKHHNKKMRFIFAHVKTRPTDFPFGIDTEL